MPHLSQLKNSGRLMETHDSTFRDHPVRPRGRGWLKFAHPVIATLPMSAVGLGVFLIGTACIIYWSFTQSAALPNWSWSGPTQYFILWNNPNWRAAITNMAIFLPVVVAANLIVGGLLAICLDRGVKFLGLFHSLFLYPYAMSLYVSGLVWQWIFDPHLGLEPLVRSWGLTWFHFAPTADPSQALAGLLVAGCWQSIGLTMAILLAGLRTIDPEIWHAARVEGISTARTYVSIILPMIRGPIGTAVFLQVVSALRTYDLSVAMADDPYRPTWMPAVYVIKSVWYEMTLRQGAAASTMLLLPIALLVALRVVGGRLRARATLD